MYICFYAAKLYVYSVVGGVVTTIIIIMLKMKMYISCICPEEHEEIMWRRVDGK